MQELNRKHKHFKAQMGTGVATEQVLFMDPKKSKNTVNGTREEKKNRPKQWRSTATGLPVRHAELYKMRSFV